MEENKTPKWLIAAQNKSWEPEILISGITLTFLFILSNRIYNFFGMLTQDFGVFDAISKSLYLISIISLTSLKIILIVHLILRGIWTGFVGLSYVLPHGVKYENLPKNLKNVQFGKPESFVIRIEKICSLLFSFIFSSITFIFGLLIVFIPFVILFLFGIPVNIISYIGLGFGLVLMLVVFGSIIYEEISKKKLPLNKMMENSILTITLPIYYTNFGRLKVNLVFVIYFGIIFLLSYSQIAKFDFVNDEPVKIVEYSQIPVLNTDQYRELRNQQLRYPRAIIDNFKVNNNKLELFISCYYQDDYTLNLIGKYSNLKNKLKLAGEIKNTVIKDLYEIYLDDQSVSGLQWYINANIDTGQKSLITTIAIDSLKAGYHELRIDKWVGKFRRNEIEKVENWDVIPFFIDE